MSKSSTARRLIPLLLSAVLVLAGFRCTLLPQKVKELLKPVALTYWRVWDSPSDFSDIINRYRSIHPNITIEMRTLRFEELADQILRAYAHGTQPDIISMPVSWLRRYAAREGFIQAMPGSVTMAYQTKQRTLGVKEEIIVEQRTIPTLTIGQLQTQYLDTWVRDVVIGGNIYGFPQIFPPKTTSRTTVSRYWVWSWPM